MKRFAQLYADLDNTTSTNAKIEAMRAYMLEAPPEDAAWAVFLLKGDRLRAPVKRANLRMWARDLAGVDEWLFDECYATVGDLAETLALVIDTRRAERGEAVDDTGDADVDAPLHEWMETRLPGLRALDEEPKREALTGWWRALPMFEIFVLNKMLTGALRVGVSRKLVVRSLAAAFEVDRNVVAHRLMGAWHPSATAFRGLFDEDTGDADASRPYPYFLASPLESDVESLGDRSDWQAEWKWDGIRGQLIKRGGEAYLWSRGEDLVSEQFPEIIDGAAALPDGTVLDGEILAWQDGAPMPFADLQRRLGRKRIGKTLLRKVPATFVAYDCMEWEGTDLREQPLAARREAMLAALGHTPTLRVSAALDAASWAALAELRAEARARRVEGVMLKRLDSPYRVGRVRGDWWKWKLDPLELDAVLLYAQPGSGRRASLLTDYTFGVWADADTLVPIAKAYSGLSNEEIRELDRWIRRHTTEKFGPVRSVETAHVFEIAFEDIRASSRHKSGVAVRFPRISRWRRDKAPADAATLDEVKAMMAAIRAAPDEPR